MKVFITRANAERIITKVDLNQIDIYSYANELEFKWFNKGELRKLKAFEELYSNPELFLRTYVKLEQKNDGKEYVFSSSSAYHTNEQCNRMLSDFKNIKIPSQIINSSRKQEFIDFCNENQKLRTIFPDQFRNRLRWRFGITENVEVHYENSGADIINNMSIHEVCARIDYLLEETNSWISESEMIREVVDTFGLQSFNFNKPEAFNLKKLKMNISILKVCEILEHLEVHFKQQLIALFKHYFQIKSNKSLSVESPLLIQLGFRYCTSCQRQEELNHLNWMFKNLNDSAA
jgi:hypothetical protein